MEIITRQEAIKGRLSRYFTGRPCLNGHIAYRYLQNSTCYECIHPTNIKAKLPIHKYRVFPQDVEIFENAMLALARTMDPNLILSDLYTKRKVILNRIRSYRIPPGIEAAMRQLESTLEVKGDKVIAAQIRERFARFK